MKRSRGAGAAMVLLIAAGITLMAMPFGCDMVSRWEQAHRINSYTQTVSQLDQSKSEGVLKAAENFNAGLVHHQFSTELSDLEEAIYVQLLDPLGEGIMGYLDIPCIGVSVPIYHGISDSVLALGAGHIPGSALPVGGEGMHTLLSGHTGLSSAKLFTDLDRMGIGDEFIITVMNRTLTYQVDEINVVEPEDMTFLRPVEGEDLCTLITCTPYGVNSHRLLVRGHRVPNHRVEAPTLGRKLALEWKPMAMIFVVGMVGTIVFLRRRKRKAEHRE